MAATTSSGRAPAGVGRRFSTSGCPTRSTTTQASSTGSKCSPTALPASLLIRRVVRGFPSPSTRLDPSSRTIPSSSSLRVIPETVCGVSPVRSAISARLMPSASWIWSSTTARL